MWSAVVRMFGCTAKSSETLLETAYDMNVHGQRLWWTFSLPAACCGVMQTEGGGSRPTQAPLTGHSLCQHQMCLLTLGPPHVRRHWLLGSALPVTLNPNLYANPLNR